MKPALYAKIFKRMDELGAIREWENMKPGELAPVFSDCVVAVHKANLEDGRVPTKEEIFLSLVTSGMISHFDFYLPLVKYQSEELGERLYALIK